MRAYQLISTTTIEFGYVTFSKQMVAKTIASADAFYFVGPPTARPYPTNQSCHALTGAIGGGALGGLVGALLDNANKGGRKKDKPLSKYIQEMRLSELFEEVTEHPDWPIDQTKGIVTIIRRRAVISRQYSFSWFWVRYRFLLKTELGTMSIFPPYFQGRKMADFLEDLGWEL